MGKSKNIGRVPWNKGLKGLQPYHDISGLSKKGERKSIGTEFKKGCSGFNRKHTEETKIKISNVQKGRKLSKEHIRNALRRREMSSLEIRVNNVIHKNNLPYKFVGNGDFFIERKNPDFININGKKIAVEVFARRHKEILRGGVEVWKKERIELFAEYGWSIIFIEDWQTNTEESILNLLQ